MTDAGYRCPTQPDHGRLVLLDTKGDKMLYCPHHDHAKPDGGGLFTYADVDQTYRLDIIKRAKAAHITGRRAKATSGMPRQRGTGL